MNQSFFQSEPGSRALDSYLRPTAPSQSRQSNSSGANFPPGFTSFDEFYSSSRSNGVLNTTGLYSTEASDPRSSFQPLNRGTYYGQRNDQSNFPSRNPSKTIWSTEPQLSFDSTLPKRDLMYEEATQAEVSLLPSNLLENQTLKPTTSGQPLAYGRNEYRSVSKVENQSRYNNNTIGEPFVRNGDPFREHRGDQYYAASEEPSRQFYQNRRYNERDGGGYANADFRGVSYSRSYLEDGSADVSNDNLFALKPEYQPHHYADRRQDTDPRFAGRYVGGGSNVDRRGGWGSFGNPAQENLMHQKAFQTNSSHLDMVSRSRLNNHPVVPATAQPRVSGRMGKCTNPELLSLYNPKSFNTAPVNARYFVIKSFTEDDVHKSLKYHIWTSTEMGNRRLDNAFKENVSRGPIYLFFSVNGSGHFCGAAQMLTPLDYSTNSTVWAQNKWKGIFSLKWIFVKDIPNAHLRHIIVPLNCNKPVTNSRDTQELNEEAGQDMLKMFLEYRHKASILDDFEFYEKKISDLTSNTPPDYSSKESRLPAASMARSSSLSSYHSNSST